MSRKQISLFRRARKRKKQLTKNLTPATVLYPSLSKITSIFYNLSQIHVSFQLCIILQLIASKKFRESSDSKNRIQILTKRQRRLIRDDYLTNESISRVWFKNWKIGKSAKCDQKTSEAKTGATDGSIM